MDMLQTILITVVTLGILVAVGLVSSAGVAAYAAYEPTNTT